MVDQTTTDSERPAVDGVAVADGVAFAVCAALACGTAGTATLTMASGAVLTDFPLQAGINPLQVSKVAFGTASDIWALYN